MRFKSTIRDINKFIKLTGSLNLVGKVAWLRLDNDQVRFTIIPETGSQVWAVLAIDSIFDDDYTIQSAAENDTINLEVPIGPLYSALKSAQYANSSSIRLTKKDNIPLLSLTIINQMQLTSSGRTGGGLGLGEAEMRERDPFYDPEGGLNDEVDYSREDHSRETVITQDVAIKVLRMDMVEGIHEPRTSPPEVHILLPPLLQLKSISERFTKLALSATKKPTGLQGSHVGPKLEISANMHGELRIGIKTDSLKIESKWSGLNNPDLDPGEVEGGEQGIQNHPSTRYRELEGEESYATVRVECRDWNRVLGVGRLGGRVVACICNDSALILYVFLPNDDPGAQESVLTYYINSYLI
jgi:HUS1 checkpoint protein